MCCSRQARSPCEPAAHQFARCCTLLRLPSSVGCAHPQARPALLEAFPWAAHTVCAETAMADAGFWPALLAAGERVQALPHVSAPEDAPEPRSLEALCLELPASAGCSYSGCGALMCAHYMNEL